ncbi:MAG: Zn-ribbon domain-containing OB-fold protein [Promethearchaeota archaeon]
MSKRTQRKSLDYIKKDYVETRRMPGSWYISNYKFKFDITHLQPFLNKLKEKKLVGLKCSGCNRVFFPPKSICGKCLMKPDQWVDLRETGEVSTFAIAYLKDPETDEVKEKPMVLIRQDGADTTFMIELNPDVEFKDTYIGMPVKVHWNENLSGNLNDIEYYDLIENDASDLKSRKD